MRLVNMGVPAHNITPAVSLIVAQRLARRLCGSCKAVHDLPQEALLEAGFKHAKLDSMKIYKPVGCDQCNNGYKGCTGIYQVMPISEAMNAIILNGGNAI
jgi:type IV pilus assembly protein PilB